MMHNSTAAHVMNFPTFNYEIVSGGDAARESKNDERRRSEESKLRTRVVGIKSDEDGDGSQDRHGQKVGDNQYWLTVEAVEHPGDEGSHHHNPNSDEVQARFGIQNLFSSLGTTILNSRSEALGDFFAVAIDRMEERAEEHAKDGGEEKGRETEFLSHGFLRKQVIYPHINENHCS